MLRGVQKASRIAGFSPFSGHESKFAIAAQRMSFASEVWTDLKCGRIDRDFTFTSGIYDTNYKRVTLVPGEGIGPEITDAVCGVFQAANVPVEWERFDNVSHDPIQLQKVITSIARNGVCLKGPLVTSSQPGAPVSRNNILRQSLDLYANVVPVKNVPGINSKYEGINLVIIRENTEGEYTGLEHELRPGVVQSLKITTTEAALRIARFAFQFAVSNNRKKVTAIHKANIQKLTDGEFIRCCKLVSQDYPSIEYAEMIVDNTCMQLASRPQQFDIMVTPNLYGTIVANVAAGLVGGPGTLPGGNFNDRSSGIFESGARHYGTDIAGKGIADPVGMLFAATWMLRRINLLEYADRIDNAVLGVIKDGVLPVELGGTRKTRELTKSIIDRL